MSRHCESLATSLALLGIASSVHAQRNVYVDRTALPGGNGTSWARAFRELDVRLRADRLSYDVPTDLARASGNVRVLHDGNVFSGPEAQITLSSFKGYVLEPTFLIGLTGAGGSAKRVDFLDSDRAVATAARYSSCPADGGQEPDWLLSADTVKLDLEQNQGVAENAVLRHQISVLQRSIKRPGVRGGDHHELFGVLPRGTLSSRARAGFALWTITGTTQQRDHLLRADGRRADPSIPEDRVVRFAPRMRISERTIYQVQTHLGYSSRKLAGLF